ncbi:REP-associated tyrosine transposase [Bacillus sp. Marseille-P3661]|uniref:REP-associated tyrosine transposase n=1 Tax=Bacillus sp. Marseille-P3661 TaxID=1936234 RepID=UPI000C85DED8|nr:transposase [Bacillus sp. Marseille-P3661]
MPRKKRVWINEYFYHIICRGNRRDPLFMDDRDFNVFFKIVDQVFERNPFEISTYCLMTNHYHLLLRSKEIPISKVIGLINKRYATYYNTRYCLTGHVFEKRYFDKLMENSEDMLETSKYIHLNPVRANIVTHPNHYSWSSFHLFQHKDLETIPRYMNLIPILGIYPGTLTEQTQNYTAAHLDTIRQSTHSF